MGVTTASQTRRNVVVTGMTATTCLAPDLDGTWSGLLAGESGIGPLDDDFVTEYDLPVRIGGKLKQRPGEHLSRIEQRRHSYVQQLALVLSRQLWGAAGKPDVDGERLGVAVGTGLGGGDAFLTAVDAMRAGGYRKVPPLTVPMVMPNGPAARVGLEFGAKAGVYAPTSACSSGAEAIAHAWRLIATGEADVVIAGGVEGYIEAIPIASFAMMRATSTRNDEPTRASRPFDRDRDGFVFGEAGALLVLESEEFALARRAEILGRVLGAGITSDGYHITGTEPEGAGAARAMRKAIEAAGLTPADITHINAHATSTPVGDASEANAIAAVAEHASVYAPKSALGHSIGAVGALEAILTLCTLRDQIVPPTLNFDNPDPGVDLDIVHGQARPQSLSHALSNSFGFGGHNVTLAFGRP
ncbi:beta-ketoacyl-ACP synthase II [Nocardia terpenica]|uniref:KasA/KasB family beta-ketoacyl-ACP synthase n=1 Tax=Nocardia terpenica TaxID=455432 RepID=UPI00189510C1|nr:KasA/KasB family beta-ketoacyl-ACP synthase [Nocardia terpenica]MBF6061193.1 beta-ketoacyl-ACP synthase II [Nocardia terpenica]MBF6105578.1 beta-ketoacyl-ACP synthase II [Nocardia terpenica]MBF6112952.1 beta-ketoacyl-ACP synthase II [Nocardia terpenica]MBF6119082.1 beta-ketoacyl-ACP synthase II [Nocardia terpenica]MBF6152730.1 beta-ketoacyl-ACP synthase II [Nocardia terpenica]